MFSYKTSSLIKKIDIKRLSYVVAALYVLGIIPMLVLGFYDWPSADDFSMALQPHLYFVETGSFLGTVWASLQKSFLVYSQYEGYFFSIILTCICPSVFGEGWYVLTPFIILGMLTFGVCYFFDALFVRVWKADRDLVRLLKFAVLIMMVQFMPAGGPRVEAFYWYSGAVNYSFTFGMAFFWLGLMMRAVFDEDEKARKRKLIWAAFWGFWMGGANYMTALELAICSVLILVIYLMVRAGRFELEVSDEGQGKSFAWIWLPAALNLVGFAFSCFSPGNAVRGAETEGYGAVKAVLLSLYSTFNVIADDMMRWETLVVLALLVPVFWVLASGIKHRFEHPVMFVLFAYLMVSSNSTPPYYAVGNLASGRLQALAWMEYVVMLVLAEFYVVAWGRQKVTGDAAAAGVSGAGKFSEATSGFIAVCAVALLFGSVLCIKPDVGYYSATSALGDLVSGNAATYKAENKERLKVLEDSAVKDAVLAEHSTKPEMLFYQDVTKDPSEWINGATALYYGKDSVRID